MRGSDGWSMCSMTTWTLVVSGVLDQGVIPWTHMPDLCL